MLYLDSKVTTKYYYLDPNYDAINIVSTSKITLKTLIIIILLKLIYL
jgi:hypothetical protein